MTDEPGIPAQDPTSGEAVTDLVPRMLRVTVAMGLSASAVIALAMVRAKLVAVELGPEGIGSVTLLVSFLAFATLVAGLGIGSSGIREIAAADAVDDRVHKDEVRAAVYAAATVLAVIGGAVVALAAEPIAEGLLGDELLVQEVRICALGAVAGIVGSAALADLNGFRRARSLAILQALAALAATILTGLAWLAGVDLVPVVVVAPPVAVAILAFAYARRLPRMRLRLDFRPLLGQVRRLVVLGLAFVLNAALATLGALVLRALIRSELGLSDTGQFQAAFAIATYYVSFVFAALATDYLPLLSGLAGDTARMNRAANTQLTVAILLSAPPVMLLVVAAPLAVPLLYSGSFDQTPDLLRIMLLSEITRVAAWTVGYVLIARGAGGLFVVTELLYNILLLAVSAALIPVLGLNGVGLGYLLCQLASLVWTLWFANRTSGFRLTRANVLTLTAVLLAQGLVYVGVVIGGLASLFAVALTAACGYAAWRRLETISGGPLSTFFRLPSRPRS